jgi:hypothetical protein
VAWYIARAPFALDRDYRPGDRFETDADLSAALAAGTVELWPAEGEAPQTIQSGAAVGNDETPARAPADADPAGPSVSVAKPKKSKP